MHSFRYFLTGFLMLATLNVFVTCSEDDGGTQPNPPLVNVDKIHEGAQRVEDAFRSADPAAVLAVLTEEAQEQYGEELSEITADMPVFADAIATRQLVGYGEYYAEYAFTVEGNTFTFALAVQDEDDWKLMRF